MQIASDSSFMSPLRLDDDDDAESRPPFPHPEMEGNQIWGSL